MKSKNIYSLAISCFLAVNFAQAESYIGSATLTNANLYEVKISGPANLTNIKAESLNIVGPVEFINLDIQEEVKVTGSVTGKNLLCEELSITGNLKAQNIKCEEIVVTGSLDLEDIDVKDELVATGSLKIKNAHINKIEVSSDEINLDNVKVNTIFIEKSGNAVSTETLYLKGNSVVGDIDFKSGKGTIIKDEQAQITGRIIGGTIK